MDKITRTGRTLIFDKRVHPGIRLGILLVGLFPLLAPYELLFKVRWENLLSLSFFISLFFSVMMTAASMFIMFIALFAQNQYIRFDGDTRMLTYGWSDAIRPYRETVHRFEELSEPELKVHTWSDSPDSYDVRVKTRSGLEVSFGDFDSREEAQNYQAELVGIISPFRQV